MTSTADHAACPDHFVGAETLRCLACGWNAATRSYDRPTPTITTTR